jgi:hypothetical protein
MRTKILLLIYSAKVVEEHHPLDSKRGKADIILLKELWRKITSGWMKDIPYVGSFKHFDLLISLIIILD